MSQTKSVNLNLGWGVPILALGLVLRFATSPTNTWGGIHTQKAGTILIFCAFIPLLILVAIALIAAIVFVIAWVLDRGSRMLNRSDRYRAHKQRKVKARIAKRQAKLRGRRVVR